jgi:two-component system sensor histidine kinase RegB
MWLSWLVRLRWVAIAAQIITLAFAVQLVDQPSIVLPALFTVISILGVANLYAARVLASGEPVPEERLLSHLALDVAALTTFFLLTGGPDNTFTSLYLVHIAMGAVMLSPSRAAALAVLVLSCYGILFAMHLPLHWERHTLDAATLMPLGKLASFTITLGSVAGFTLGLARSLRSRKQQLLEARDRTARIDRLRSVGTLAAGAAHELNTPLFTIGLRLRRLDRRHDDPESERDLQVIKEQLDRCTRVVNQLLVGAGDPNASGIERRPLLDLVQEGTNLWSKGSPLDIRILDDSKGAVVELPNIAFVQALINLLENARQAQDSIFCTDPLEIRLHQEAQFGVVTLTDHGCGLPETLEQVGEPFFTTKVHGTGLGVFVARQVADGAGGGLTYTPAPEGGTVARWWFPQVNRRSE